MPDAPTHRVGVLDEGPTIGSEPVDPVAELVVDILERSTILYLRPWRRGGTLQGEVQR